MKFRDTLKFALERFLPDRLTQPGGSLAADPKPEAATNAEASQLAAIGKARRIIEELDHGKFGGPSFGQQTIELMSRALEQATASLPEPASDQQVRSLAETILRVAGDGERDLTRLKTAALSATGLVTADAEEFPPSS